MIDREPATRTQEDRISDALHRDPRSISRSQVDQLLSGASGYNFESLYRAYPASRKKPSNNPEKFDIAYALIEDGRYGTQVGQDIKFLIDSFISPGSKVTPEARIFQDRLRILLVQKGRVVEGSKFEKEARESFARICLSDETLSQLCQVLPIGFMGAIARIEFYKNIKDPSERERLRAFTTKALLRPYLGDFSYVKPEGDLNFRNILDLIPDEVFDDSDEVTLNLANHYLENEVLKFFIDGEDEGFSRLQETINNEISDVKRSFLERLQTDLISASTISIPPVFKDAILDEVVSNIVGQDIYAPFPHLRQKYFVYKFLQTGKKFLCADTGAAKTACSYLAMKASRRERVVVFGPANARATWPEQAKKHFKEGMVPEVFAVESRDQLNDPRMQTAEYVYISSDLLSHAEFQPKKTTPNMSEEEKEEINRKNQELARSAQDLKALLVRTLDERGTDGVIIEEAQEFKSKDSNCAKVVSDLVRRMQRNYQPKTLLETEMPILALTATPILSDLEDMNIPMALLYPEKYGLPGEENLPTFSSACDYQPEIAFIKLYGEELLMQWTTEDMFGDKVPTLKFEDLKRVQIPMTPELRVVYDWLAHREDIGVLSKLWLLRCALINPGVIRDLNKDRTKRWYTSSATIDELKKQLEAYYIEWQDWTWTKNEKIASQPFSANWVALQPGGSEFLLDCFFHDNLAYGFESLAGLLPDLDVAIPQAPSPKAEFIRNHLLDVVKRDSDGNFRASRKVVIISNEQTLGITSYFEDEQDGVNLDTFSLYDLILGQWLQGVSRDFAINVDGTLPFPLRRNIARVFREDGLRYSVVVLNRESMEVSIDMAPRNTPAMANIEGVDIISLGLAYHWGKQRQIGGRFARPGLGKPLNFWVLENDESFDLGLFNLVRRSYLLTQLVLAGVRLDRDDADFMDKTKAAKRIIEVAPNIDQFFIRNAIRSLRGAGEDALADALAAMSEGVSISRRWAEFYYADGSDEYRLVGNNAELVKGILVQGGGRDILVVGAGSCLVDRKIKKTDFDGRVVNVDMNSDVLALAKDKHPEVGEIRQARASELPFENESFDALDYSFVLDMTQLFRDWRTGSLAATQDIQRVKTLQEMNRVLKTGGKVVITLPEGCLDDEHFATFVEALTKHFGFKVVEEYTGQSFTQDTKPQRRLGWIITLEKVGRADISDLNPNDLFFLTDDRIGVSHYRGSKDSKGGVVVVENPLFRATTFEVFNPITQAKTVAGTTANGHTGTGAENGSNGLNGAKVQRKNQIELDQEKLRQWEELRDKFSDSLGRSDTDMIIVLTDIFKALTSDSQRDWFRRVVRVIEDRLRSDGRHLLSNPELNYYDEAEIIALSIYLGEKFFLEKDLNSARVVSTLRRDIDLRFNPRSN